MKVPVPRRGDVWWAVLDPVVGHEQGGHSENEPRPAIIVSDDPYNAMGTEMVVIVPITGSTRRFLYHVPLTPPDGGVTKPSVAMCEQVRAVSTRRLSSRMGMVSAQTLALIELRLRRLLRLPLRP